uniref:Uncharacterized protein n=1 Tax=Sipha flava TaxID=143950 RepID=A0A2S2QKM4_9HEMI
MLLPIENDSTIYVFYYLGICNKFTSDTIQSCHVYANTKIQVVFVLIYLFIHRSIRKKKIEDSSCVDNSKYPSLVKKVKKRINQLVKCSDKSAVAYRHCYRMFYIIVPPISSNSNQIKSKSE